MRDAKSGSGGRVPNASIVTGFILASWAISKEVGHLAERDHATALDKGWPVLYIPHHTGTGLCDADRACRHGDRMCQPASANSGDDDDRLQ